MDVQTMMSRLAIRLEDTDSDNPKFDIETKLNALEHAQQRVANLMRKEYLTELQVIKENATATAGKLAISVANLGFEVCKGKKGIIGVKIYGGDFCIPVDTKDLKALENALSAGGVNNPIFYVFRNNIYVVSGVANPAIDIYFLKIPDTLRYKFTSDQADSGASTTKFDGAASEGLSAVDDYYNDSVIYNITKGSYHVVTDYVGADLEFTVEPAAAANFTEGQEFYFITHDFDQINLSGAYCELNEALHVLVLDLAEGECWAIDGKADRSANAEKKALDEIVLLNSKFEKKTGE